MLKANTGSSLNPDAGDAGREAARQAKKDIQFPKIILAHASGEYYQDLNDLADAVRKEFPGVPVIGSTSWRGVILPQGLVGGRRFVGLLALADEDLTVAAAAANNEDGSAESAVAAGQRAARAALARAGRFGPPDYYYLAAMPGFEEFYIQGITKVIGSRPMFGVGAMDNPISGDWDIFTDQGVVGDGLAVAFFYTSRPMVNHFTSEPYREMPNTRLPAEMVAPRRVKGMGGQLILDLIVHHTGFDPELLIHGDVQLGTICDPIGVPDRPDGRISLRFPMNLKQDGTVDLGANLAEGATTIHMRAGIEDLVTAGGRELAVLNRRLAPAAPAAYHLAIGFGRGLVLAGEERLAEAAEHIRRAAGGVPFLGSFSMSESGSGFDGPATTANLMLSYTAFPR